MLMARTTGTGDGKERCGVLTISSGYDPGYLTRAVATGRENYYLSAVAEHGEPPGTWTGRGCPELGLAVGAEVDNRVMERLYGAFTDPRDPEHTATLGRAPSGFAGNSDKVSERITRLLAAEPDATAERRGEIIMQAMKDRRAAVFFFDATFSVPKSVSLLHASLQLRATQAREAGQAAEAGQWAERAQAVWDAIMAGNQAMLDYLQREAGYSRAGYHSAASGRFVDAHDWVIASFPQHTSRDNDPQLHIHNPILNRVLRADPLASRPCDSLAWRTLDGAALYAARPAAAAIAERTMNEALTERLGVRMTARPDGNGWEVTGISEGLRDQFSSRRRAITPRVRELADAYRQRHGRPPDARALWSMAQFVTLESRQAKAHSAPSREDLLARWERQSRRAETEALSTVPDAVLGQHDDSAGHGPSAPSEVSRMLTAAVADVLQRTATFSRYELTRMISRYLPDSLGGLAGDQVTALLDDLTAQALAPGGPCGVVLLTAPEMVPVPAAFRRADGLSLWRRHGAEAYTTRAMLDTETRLLRAAAQTGAPRISSERAAAAIAADQARVEARLWREYARSGAAEARERAAGAPDGAPAALSGAGLADDQALAAYAILTSGRAIDILIGPAGTGKTRTVARIAQAWQDAGRGRVIGLAVSTNAAHTLAAEGLDESYNLARFLGRGRAGQRGREHVPVRPGDLLIVDEASMVPTSDLAAVEAIAARCGAKILLTGDPEQLSAPEAGGAMRLLADEHGYYQLSTVQRFDQEWERAASLRLRAGDTGVLAEYDQRGRVLEGTREQMTETAYRRWLADHLSGKLSVLLATTNVQAAELARRARDELAALGKVAATDLVELADGNEAGAGDLIVARQNARIWAGYPRRQLANRDVLRIESWAEIGEERTAIVRRVTGRDPVTGRTRWSVPFEVPERYIEQHAELAYAGNVHVAQGRTVDTAHLVIDDTASREALYVGMSRGRERNTAYVITEPARVADLAAETRPAPGIAGAPAGEAGAEPGGRFAVLAAVLGREQAERTATETMRRELEQAASLATLAPMWADVIRAHAARRYDQAVRSLVTDADWERYTADPERATLARLLRAAELSGHDAEQVLRSAIQDRDFTAARSIAAVLHGRVERITGMPEPMSYSSYADRTPAITDPVARQFASDLAAVMDDRVAELGNEVTAERPLWALRYLGDVPADPVERAEWTCRAGIAAAYREERGYAHDTDPIGPAPGRGSPELRASWHAAYTALRMPGQDRHITAATDGELSTMREAYVRETAWAPPYVADELREAHLAEDQYRADAVLAEHQAAAAAGEVERMAAERQAAQCAALAQEVGAYREKLAEIADARRQWHTTTETARQRALAADIELRRRHPDSDLPPLHQDAEPEADSAPQENGQRPRLDERDLNAALDAARQAQAIIVERQRQASQHAAAENDDVTRRRQAAAEHEAATRRGAVRQPPAHSRYLEAERDELELGAGQ
jgi:conjugative relaxase-like TrwC/TraI family protein